MKKLWQEWYDYVEILNIQENCKISYLKLINKHLKRYLFLINQILKYEREVVN